MTIYFGDSTSQSSAGMSSSGGKILQLRSSCKRDVWTSSSTGALQISGTDQNGSGSVWCVKITPSSSSSKVYVTGDITLPFASVNDTSTGIIYRGSTVIGQGDAHTGPYGSAVRGSGFSYIANSLSLPSMTLSFLDSPSSTSELTYSFRIDTYNSDTTGINRTSRDNGGGDGRVTSTITAMEISAY